MGGNREAAMESKANYQNYLRSDLWKVLRRQRLILDQNACALCGDTLKIEVHHRKYPRFYGEESIFDLITLCENCHRIHHLGVGRKVGPARAAIKPPNYQPEFSYSKDPKIRGLQEAMVRAEAAGDDKAAAQFFSFLLDIKRNALASKMECQQLDEIHNVLA